MSPKNFQSPPQPNNCIQPSDEQIAAFEQGGVGHDKNSQTHIFINNHKPISEPTKRLSIDLFESDHYRFKVACSAAKTTMMAEVSDFIKKRTDALEKEAGITLK